MLVDEFQDISAGRMALLHAIKGPGVAYFLVGDDWQSINRFAGSDVGLMRECGRYLGHVRERALGRTFRFARGIMEPSTAFVARNPAQTQRTLRPAEGVRDGGVTVIASEDPARGLRDVLRDIQECEGPSGAPVSVLVLGRYRRSRGALPSSRRGPLRVEFSTVHAAKGREADYVVVLDLRDARRGFPSQHEDDPLLGLVLPPPPGGSYRHAEERRLFYVALTRARRGTYLVADSLRPSAFVNELLRESTGLRRLGEFRRDRTPTCPRCHTGNLDVPSTGQSMSCMNFPFCRYRAPRCQRCRRGFLVISGRSSRCTNATCNASPPACGSCRAGVMVTRKGRTGWFLGCSQYGSDQPCTNTERLPKRSSHHRTHLNRPVRHRVSVQSPTRNQSAPRTFHTFCVRSPLIRNRCNIRVLSPPQISHHASLLAPNPAMNGQKNARPVSQSVLTLACQYSDWRRNPKE